MIRRPPSATLTDTLFPYTTLFRSATVEVRTLQAGVHSGQFGGAAPDAISALARLIATLHDERGNCAIVGLLEAAPPRSEEHTSELQSLMRISYAVFCLKKKKDEQDTQHPHTHRTSETYIPTI